MPFQDWIHQLDVGRANRFIKITMAVLAVLFLIIGYNMRAYKNMWTPEAMDSAQLAHNIAQGRGYTTSFVRPFSMFLIKQANQADGQSADLSRIKDLHPDLANPPVYPVLLAGL